ncbi:uncharacterized protein BDV17DRAFT_115217 [Aspergillus undulatus]|uniref:uncharacterized protein n=1 Tax=Aspergillus undulatus TaxID=1810928 RepID=UPI003CCC95B8
MLPYRETSLPMACYSKSSLHCPARGQRDRMLKVKRQVVDVVKANMQSRNPNTRMIPSTSQFGTATISLGFGLRNLDTWACDALLPNARSNCLRWAFLLELDGSWQILTGIGAYIFIAVIDHFASGKDHENIGREIAWPASWASRPFFVGREAAPGREKRA